METLLDGLNLLVGTNELPAFEVWIIGGSQRELRTVNAWVKRRRGLRRLQERGLLLLWGRVARDALAELMSRSSVLVMTSNREQYGIAAIEAMMCGCPILASRIGGLPDIVVDGRVGHLVNPGDHTAVAFALAGLLREPTYWRSLGRRAARWTAENFTQTSLFNRLRQLYIGKPISKPHRIESAAPFFIPVLRAISRTAAERLLGEPLRCVELLSEGQFGATFVIKTDVQRAVAKIVRTMRDPAQALFYGTRRASVGIDPFRAYSTKLSMVRDSGLAPRVLAHDPRRSLLLLEWLDGSSGALDHATLAKLQGWRLPPPEHCEDIRRAVASLLRSRTAAALRTVDDLARTLNAECAGDGLQFHPVVELERLRQYLAAQVWPLPKFLAKRLTRAVHDHVDAWRNVDGPIVLCHGDLRPGHVLETKDGTRLLGWRSMHFASQSLDEAQWTLHTANDLTLGVLDASATAAALFRFGADPRSAIAWVAAETLTIALRAASHGDTRVLASAPAFVEGLLVSGRKEARFPADLS